MKKILITLGQIPAKLDAVKYIGNKFQGGLMVKLARELVEEDIKNEYDMVTEKNIYETFHKEFEIKFRYTKNGVWCLMNKKI